MNDDVDDRAFDVLEATPSFEPVRENAVAIHQEQNVAQSAPGSDILEIIARAATDPRVDVVKMQALLDMQERVLAKQAVAQFNAALHAAQREMPRVKKNGTIDMGAKGSMRFATLEDVDSIVRPIMDKYGLSLSFDTQHRENGGSVVVGTLMHEAGHSKTAAFSLPLDTGAGRNNLQAAGSTLSYGRRYITEMLFNIIREQADDDGKTGGMRFVTHQQAEEISALVDETNADPQRFLEWVFGDEESHNYREIPAEKFTGVINALKSRQRRMKAEGGMP